MVEGPQRLDGIRFREGSRPGGPEVRNEVRVVRSVETQVREEQRPRGRDRSRALLALVVAGAVVAGALILNFSVRQEPNQRPLSALHPDRTLVFAGEAVFFDGSGSTDPDGSLDLFQWHFSPGGLCETRRPSLTRHFEAPGVYNVSLRVTDDRGEGSSLSRVQVVAVPRPVTSAAQARTLEELDFSVDNSTLAGAPVGFSWNFSDGTAAVSGPAVRHAFARGGNYTVLFQASWRLECIAAHLRVNISNRPPAAYYNISEPGPYYTNHPWTFDGSRSEDRDGRLAAWFWDFGDGTVDGINGSVVTHSFSRSGAFRAMLSVTDNDGAATTMTRDIVVGKDMFVVLVSAQTYTDRSGNPRANVTVTFDNPGDAKTAGAVRVSVTAHTPAQNDISDPQSSGTEFCDREVPAGLAGLAIRVDGLLISSYLPEKTWYLVELSYMSSVVDTRWYQKY